jgi:hypothetical protein
MRRIVVMQQTWRAGDTLLRAAAGAATRMNAELTGLFIEDINLLHLAGMPFASEVCFPSGIRREMDVGQLERSLRALAGEAQRALETAARRTALRSSFRVARGSPLAELLAAASETDVVVAGALSQTSSSAAELSVVSLASVAPAAVAGLIRELAPWARGSITVVVLGTDADTALPWETRLRELLGRNGLARRVRVLAPRDQQELESLLKLPAIHPA